MLSIRIGFDLNVGSPSNEAIPRLSIALVSMPGVMGVGCLLSVLPLQRTLFEASLIAAENAHASVRRSNPASN